MPLVDKPMHTRQRTGNRPMGFGGGPHFKNISPLQGEGVGGVVLAINIPTLWGGAWAIPSRRQNAERLALDSVKCPIVTFLPLAAF